MPNFVRGFARAHCNEATGVCSYGPDGFDDSANGCSTGCPAGYAVQNVSCVNCGGGGGACAWERGWYNNQGRYNWACSGECNGCAGCRKGGATDSCRCIGQCPAPNPCSLVGPSGLSVTTLSQTSSQLNWTPESGAASQSVYIGSDSAAVSGNCPSGIGGSTGCVVAQTGLSNALSSYATGGILTAGTVYYYKVVSYNSVSCNRSATVNSLSSCSLSPLVLSLGPSENGTLTASVNSSSEIQRVDFSSSNPSVAAVAPSSDNSYPYQTTVIANTSGNAVITATVYSSLGTTTCQSGSASYPGSQNASVTVINATPWWQVRDGDTLDFESTVSLKELTSACALG